MDGKRKDIYDDLRRDLQGFPVEDFVRAYAKAYLEADIETIRKLQDLLVGDPSENCDPDSGSPNEPDSLVGTPIQPRPHSNSGAVALPEPDNPDLDHL
jgi:hypothetical protein